MKIKTRISLFLALMMLAVSILGVTVFAEGEEPSPVGFTVYDSEMNEKPELSGTDGAALAAAVPLLADGDTVVLNSDLRVKTTFNLISSEEAPREINLDLAGNCLYQLEKSNLIYVRNYTTLNVYSSLPGGELYSTSIDNPGKGSNIYTIGGPSAVINSGTFTVGDTTYPGENLSTYSACLLDLITSGDGGNDCDENSYIRIDGGNHYSICSDYTGFIIPRCGKATISIKNANIIMADSKTMINSAGAETLLMMENCIMLQAKGQHVNLFNNAAGKTVLTNCITNYKLASGEAMAVGSVELVGRNVFADAETPTLSLVKTDSVLTAVTTSSEYELYGGGKTVKYLDGYDNWNYISIRMDKLDTPVRYVAEEDVRKYTFNKDESSVTQYWASDEAPVFPYTLPTDKKEGVYKYAWQLRYAEDGGYIYTVEKVSDAPLLVSVSDDEELRFNVYIPANFDEEGVLNYSGVMMDGSSYSRSDWERVTKNGEEYIRASVAIDPENVDKVIEIIIPVYYSAELNMETIWRINLSGYIDRVLSTEEEGVYTEAEYKFVRELLSSYFE